jgi:hypothetical protein
VVLFGGCCDSAGFPLSETWTFDGKVWELQHPADSPPALTGALMASGAAMSGVVLFGGFDGQVLRGDTWLWNGANWREIAYQSPFVSSSPTTGHPPFGVDQKLTYYPPLRLAVLHGYPGSPCGTWGWDGYIWRPLPGDGLAGDDVAMTYDAALRRIVLLLMASGPGGLPALQTWSWDGKRWHEVS